jgi:tRNA pseudouridine13 synthase
MKLWAETRDAKEVLNKFYWKQSNEGHILKGLVKGGNRNFCSALTFIPRNNRNMYLHSYQSFLWNKLASFRIQKFGLKVLPGDLLLFQEPDDEAGEGPKEKPPKVEPVFADESNMDKATIYDVVIPLPGTQIVFPRNEVGEKLVEFLTEDGLDLDKFKSNSRDYTFYGAYRKLLMKPRNVDWSLISYEDPCLRLIPTDLELLKGTGTVPENKGSKKALRLSFSLPSSGYATVFIRELLKRNLTMF